MIVTSGVYEIRFSAVKPIERSAGGNTVCLLKSKYNAKRGRFIIFIIISNGYIKTRSAIIPPFALRTG
jgi:hypothetical protein